ncbi:hypothetical protein [Natrarchaeobius halalkaliphilus]|uniref:hypothetical protein n=1 Tax=Natrarchaeobius halalkaliphilus TaxID=1679091 RepID=UPI001A9E0D6C|nr:hypothetical protein [Natrarchaeobius halalkaliphilus]
MSDATPDIVDLADTVSALLYAVAGWLSIAFGIIVAGGAILGLVQSGISTGSALLAGFMLLSAFVFVSLGVFVNPRFRRRLNRRHGRSQFGKIRSVDQRVVRPDESHSQRCVACRSRVEKGLVRRYREEYAVAGVPVYTSSEGYNYYCLECATSDFLGETTTGASKRDLAVGDDRRSTSADDRTEPPDEPRGESTNPRRERESDDQLRERE